MTAYDSNFERRRFMRYLALASGVGTFGLFAGSGRGSLAQPGGGGVIAFTAPTSYDIGGTGWSQLTKAAGITVRFTDNGNDVGPVLARMTTGTMARDFDVQGLQGGAEPELARAGLIEPWDLSAIPNWSSVWESAKGISYTSVGGKRYGIPIALNADSIIYLPDEVRKVSGYEDGVVDSYAAVFDPKFAGRTSMEDAWINSAIFTAIFLKAQGEVIEDPGNLTASELKSVMTFLIDKKRTGQFKKFWRGWEQGVQLAKSREAVVMTGWEPIVKALTASGMNAAYAIPKEGYEGWTNTLILQPGARSRNRVEAAHAFANWLLDGFYGCALIKLRGYVVPSDRTAEFAATSKLFDPVDINGSIKHVRDKLTGRVFWQNVRPAEYKLYDEWWDKLRNA